MKHSFALTAVAVLALFLTWSCKKGPSPSGKDFEADISLSSEIGDVKYAEPLVLEGAVSCSEASPKITAIAVSKSGETYSEVGEEQELGLESGALGGLFFVDSKQITHIKIIISVADKSKAFYFPVGSVSGELDKDFYMDESVVLMADNKVPTHENDPVGYPVAGTGAGSTTKSFFSMHGVRIGGKVEHVLDLSQCRSVDGLNVSLCWLNCLENTSKPTVTYIGSQRGYMFSGCRRASLAGGTTGRQCDVYEVDNHGIKDENIDYYFGMKVVPGSWAGEKYDENLYRFIDGIFLKIRAAESNLDKIRAIYYLSDIQKQFDNATLGETENPVSLTKNTFLRRWADAGHSSSNPLVENFRAGDYVIISSKRGPDEDPKYYYGIIQILQLPDDSATFKTNDAGKMYIDQELAADLFMKPAYFSIKTQCEIL